MSFIKALILIVCSCLATTAIAAEPIAAIDIQGQRKIEKETIEATLYSRVGQDYDLRTISRDIHVLMKTGFFRDIKVFRDYRPDGLHLRFEVSENPLISEFSVEGADEFKEKDLKVRLKLKPGTVYNDVRVNHDIQTLVKGYAKKGYYQTRVTPIATETKDGFVKLVLKVDEGDVTRIRHIRFIGNEHLLSIDLSDQLRSQEPTLMSWVSDRNIYKKDMLEADAQLISQYYMNHGYLDAQIESTVIAMSPDKKWFDFTFKIHEDIQYHIGKVSLTGDTTKEDQVDFKKVLHLGQGDLYTIDALRRDIAALNQKIGDQGYAYATVTPMFHRHPNKGIVDLTFDINKGKKVYVERIEFSGNHKTEDFVLRRETRQYEGELYSLSRVNMSKKRLVRKEFFEDVKTSLPKGSRDDQVIMKVDVVEKQTGTVALGLGYSQLNKTFISGRIKESNLLGKGYFASASAEIGLKTQNFDISVTDPYLFADQISGTTHIFKTQTKLGLVAVPYNRNDWGGSFSLGIPLAEEVNASLGYSYSKTNLTNLPATAPFYLQAQAGRHTTGEMITALSWDTRNRTMGASSGHFEYAGFNWAGLVGDYKFFETIVSSESYFDLGDGFILRPKVKWQMIQGYGGANVPVYRNYSLGGIGSLRGFDAYGVTIRDPLTQTAIGGGKTASASLDLFFPLPYIRTSGFRGVTFIDSGTVADFGKRLSMRSIRYSVGVGFEWMSPIGPLGIAWSLPLKVLPGDLTRTFEFSLGAQF